MLFKKLLPLMGASLTMAASRPANTSICDYYTTALLKNNTAANQYALLTVLVNTVVIGNYTQPNVGVMVPGILAAGMYNGTPVNLLPYFSGGLESSNRGGMSGVSVNFLDGGGAAPLMMNMPANDTSSNQYFLLTHLYSFFGALLGCSMYGMGAFPSYMGEGSMYEVHKFMDLNPYQVGYFIEQVAMAGASFGVENDDLQAVGQALNKLFGVRCAPPTTVIPSQGPQLQAICIDSACPVSPNATCSSYEPVMVPKNTTSGANATAPGSGPTPTTSMMSSTGTMTGTSMPSTVTAGAAVKGLSLLAAAGGFAALLL